MKLTLLSLLTEEKSYSSAVDSAAKQVLDMAEERCYKVNGEVDADGIDDFINSEADKFFKDVRAKARELNK